MRRAKSRSDAAPTGADGASRAPRPRARVDVADLPRARATDADAETTDADADADALAAKRRAFHAARGVDVAEHGGPRGLEPTRYGDWERGGRASDF